MKLETNNRQIDSGFEVLAAVAMNDHLCWEQRTILRCMAEDATLQLST
jgi:hypothetical protein